MFNVNSNVISITRGDTGYITLALTKDGEAYTMAAGDAAVLTVKKTVNDAAAVFAKTFADNNIVIAPSDTSRLEYGDYVYDVQLTLANGDVNTVIAPHVFKILSEVTY